VWDDVSIGGQVGRASEGFTADGCALLAWVGVLCVNGVDNGSAGFERVGVAGSIYQNACFSKTSVGYAYW
jgi:hypothetical protein